MREPRLKRKLPEPVITLTPVTSGLPSRDEYWRQKDGSMIAVGDMDDQHVRNTLRLILRHARRRREYDEVVDNRLDEEIWRSDKDW